MEKLIDRILMLVERYLPTFLLGLGLGFKRGARETTETKKKLLEQEIETELVKNELQVLKENSGRSDGDVIRDAIEQGRRIETKRD